MKTTQPVPWIANNPENSNGWWVIEDAEGAELGSCDGGFEKPDAFLMAAAPDLFDALLPFSNYACNQFCGCHNCKAKTAITKAIATEI